MTKTETSPLTYQPPTGTIFDGVRRKHAGDIHLPDTSKGSLTPGFDTTVFNPVSEVLLP